MLPELQGLGHPIGVDGASAAEGDQTIASLITTALNQVDAGGIGHILIDDMVHAPGGACQIDPERLGHMLTNGFLGPGPIQPHLAAEEVIRIEIAQDEIGIGHRWFAAAESVAGRSRIGTGAIRSHLQQTKLVNARDATAASADLDHLDDRHLHRQAAALS